MLEHTEKMQHIEMTGVSFEQPVIGAFRLVEPPLPVQRDGIADRLRRIGGGRAGRNAVHGFRIKHFRALWNPGGKKAARPHCQFALRGDL
jgi:hypothetical protein